jgi:proton-dependent oligopeptide transporter, POT family
MTKKTYSKSIWNLFWTMIGERLNFYAVRSMLVLYLVTPFITGGFGWSNGTAIALYGAFMAVAYCTPLIGGPLSDRFFGPRRAMAMGGMAMVIGQLLLALHAPWALFTGLAMMAIGNGLFKPSATSMLGSAAPDDRTAVDRCYVLFYTGINWGIFLAPIVCGWAGSMLSLPWAFGMGGLAMMIALLIFWRHPKSAAQVRPKTQQSTKRPGLTPAEKTRTWAMIWLCLFMGLWIVAYEQGGGLLMVLAQQMTERHIGGWEVPAAWLASLTPLALVLLAPVVSWLWGWLERHNIRLTTGAKIAFGCSLAAVGCSLMALGSFLNPVLIPLHWHIWFNLILGFSELFVIPVLWAAVSRAAPNSYAASLMAATLVAIGLFSLVAGGVGSLINTVSPAALLLGVGTSLGLVSGLLMLFHRRLMAMECRGLEDQPQLEDAQLETSPAMRSESPAA